MSAFYNEHDPYAAQWLRNLIAAGHIAPGVVSEEDIRDLDPAYLQQFTQCHFFAGIGVWSLALRRAGWRDDWRIWTGSCPCQPFSAAGLRAGVDDERHLWPHFHHLIEVCRPPVVLGEQVASKDGLGWIDLVQADLEGSGYAFGASDLCAAGFGVGWQESQAGQWLRGAIQDCPDPLLATELRDFADWADRSLGGEAGQHIRQRLYFVGLSDASSGGCGELGDAALAGGGGHPDGGGNAPRGLGDASDALGRAGERGAEAGTGPDQERRRGPAGLGPDGGLGDSDGQGRELEPQPDDEPLARGEGQGGRDADGRGGDGGLADAHGGDPAPARQQRGGEHGLGAQDGGAGGSGRGGPQSGAAGGLDDPAGPRHLGPVEGPEGEARDQARLRLPREGRGDQRLADEHDARPQGRGRPVGGGEREDGQDASRGPAGGLGDPAGGGREVALLDARGGDAAAGIGQAGGAGDAGPADRSDAALRRRHAVDWLFCRDGKWRPVGSGAFPLAYAPPARMGRLRAYGNALDAETAEGFIASVMEVLELLPTWQVEATAHEVPAQQSLL